MVRSDLTSFDDVRHLPARLSTCGRAASSAIRIGRTAGAVRASPSSDHRRLEQCEQFAVSGLNSSVMGSIASPQATQVP
jgi:hypothetical protein